MSDSNNIKPTSASTWSGLYNWGTNKLADTTNDLKKRIEGIASTTLEQCNGYDMCKGGTKLFSEVFDLDPQKSQLTVPIVKKVVEHVDNISSVAKNTSEATVNSTNTTEDLLPPEEPIAQALPKEMPIKRLLREIILTPFKRLSIPLPPEIEKPEISTEDTSVAFYSILGATALQHSIAYYFDNLPSANPFYSPLSYDVSMGSMLGTVTSWAFHQNLYEGAALGTIIAVPTGIALNSLQKTIGNTGIQKIEQVKDKLLYGSRTFLECTIGAMIGTTIWNTLPVLIEDTTFDTSIRVTLSAVSALAGLSHLQAAYPRFNHEVRGPRGIENSPALTLTKYLIQGALITASVLYMSTAYSSKPFKNY